MNNMLSRLVSQPLPPPLYFTINGMLCILSCLSVSCLVLVFIVVSGFCKNRTDPRLVCVGRINSDYVKDLVLDSGL